MVDTTTTANEELNKIYQNYVTKATQSHAAVESNNRMIFLNESYRKKQTEYNILLFYVLIGLLVFLFLVAIKRFFPFIPSTLMDFFIVILFLVILIFVAYKIFDIQRRYKLNFDELDIPTNIALSNDGTIQNKDTIKKIDDGKLTDLIAAGSNDCVGAACCGIDGYNASTKMCN